MACVTRTVNGTGQNGRLARVALGPGAAAITGGPVQHQVLRAVGGLLPGPPRRRRSGRLQRGLRLEIRLPDLTSFGPRRGCPPDYKLFSNGVFGPPPGRLGGGGAPLGRAELLPQRVQFPREARRELRFRVRTDRVVVPGLEDGPAAPVEGARAAEGEVPKVLAVGVLEHLDRTRLRRPLPRARARRVAV